MDLLPLVTLVVLSLLLYRYPVFALGLSITFFEALDQPLAGTKVRVIWTVLITIRAAIFVLLESRKSSSNIFARLIKNTYVWLFSFFLAGVAYSWMYMEQEDIHTVTYIMISICLPIVYLIIFADTKVNILQAINGIAIGTIMQSYFEISHYYAEYGSLIFSQRLGLDTKSQSRMLVSAWFGLVSISAGYLYSNSKGTVERIFLMLISIYMGALMLLSGTRSTIFAMLCASVFLGRRMLTKTKIGIGVIMLALLVLFVQIPWVNEITVVQRFVAFSESPGMAFDSRLVLWEKALFNDFVENPVIGKGLFVSGNIIPVVEWDRNLGKIETTTYYRENYENMYLTVLVETGVIGLVIFIYILIKTSMSAMPHRKQRNSEDTLYKLLNAWLVFAIIRAFFYGSVVGATDLVVALALLSAVGYMQNTSVSS